MNQLVVSYTPIPSSCHVQFLDTLSPNEKEKRKILPKYPIKCNRIHLIN